MRKTPENHTLRHMDTKGHMERQQITYKSILKKNQNLRLGVISPIKSVSIMDKKKQKKPVIKKRLLKI